MRRFFLIFCFIISVSGCNMLGSLPGPGGGGDKPVVPDDPISVYAEQDYWDQLAKSVNSDVFNNSDELCATVDKLKMTGELKDVSRIDEVRKTRIDPIRDSDKSAIVSALKGGE